jgi:hypothetical protein
MPGHVKRRGIMIPETYLDGILWVFMVAAGLIGIFIIVSVFMLVFFAPRKRRLS